MSDKQRVSVRLDRSTVEALDNVADQFSISRSRMLRDLIGQQLDSDELSDAVVDAIPEETRKLAIREEREERMLDRQKLRERKHSFDDRIRGFFRSRIEGDSAYTPEGMEDLAQGYREDARIWFDDEDAIEDKEQAVDQWLNYYRLGYWARQHSDEIESEIQSNDVDSWFTVGEDIYQLREDAESVVERIQTIADTQGVGYDSDAVVDAVSSQWSVCRGSVLLLIEQLTEEDSSITEMLRLGGDTIDLSGIDQQALTAGDEIGSVDQLPEDAVVTRGGDLVETDGGEP